MRCKSCGNDVKSDYKFCPFCASRLTQDFQDHYEDLEPAVYPARGQEVVYGEGRELPPRELSAGQPYREPEAYHPEPYREPEYREPQAYHPEPRREPEYREPQTYHPEPRREPEYREPEPYRPEPHREPEYREPEPYRPEPYREPEYREPQAYRPEPHREPEYREPGAYHPEPHREPEYREPEPYRPEPHREPEYREPEAYHPEPLREPEYREPEPYRPEPHREPEYHAPEAPEQEPPKAAPKRAERPGYIVYRPGGPKEPVLEPEPLPHPDRRGGPRRRDDWKEPEPPAMDDAKEDDEALPNLITFEVPDQPEVLPEEPLAAKHGALEMDEERMASAPYVSMKPEVAREPKRKERRKGPGPVFKALLIVFIILVALLTSVAVYWMAISRDPVASAGETGAQFAVSSISPDDAALPTEGGGTADGE